MPAIRRRYHYANLIMCPAIYGESKALCGQTVDVLDDYGETQCVHFYGFVAWREVSQSQFCLVKNVVGYTPENAPFVGNWVTYHYDNLILGVRESNGIKLVVKMGELVVAGHFTKQTERKSSSVVSLF